MKLVVAIKSFSHFKEIKNKIDGVVIGNKEYSTTYPISFEIEEMKEIIKYANENKKICVINVMNLLTNDKMESLKALVMELMPLNPYFMFSDAGVFTLLKGLGIINLGIYDPQTLITNSMDMNLYLSEGIEACGLSLEIPVSDIAKLNSLKKGKVMLKAFGYHQMFHSKRHLLSTYFKYIDKNIKIDNESSYLKEETRDEKYHIVENDNGTILYRSYVLNYIDSLDLLYTIDYVMMDSVFIDEDTFNKALYAYSDVLNGRITKEDAKKTLNSLNLEYKDGFMYEDTVYQKEKVSR